MGEGIGNLSREDEKYFNERSQKKAGAVRLAQHLRGEKENMSLLSFKTLKSKMVGLSK